MNKQLPTLRGRTAGPGGRGEDARELMSTAVLERAISRGGESKLVTRWPSPADDAIFRCGQASRRGKIVAEGLSDTPINRSYSRSDTP